MDYGKKFQDAIDALHREGRYRVFADLKRQRGNYPHAYHVDTHGAADITVWCSNDYLGMSQHAVVTNAMHEAID